MFLLAIAVAGAIGAPARYLVDGYVQARTDRATPLGTLIVNISGSFVLGLVTGLALYHSFRGVPRAMLATGFCGAYTTFSTFAYETVRLLEDGERGAAAQNVVLSLLIPPLAAAAGLALATL